MTLSTIEIARFLSDLITDHVEICDRDAPVGHPDHIDHICADGRSSDIALVRIIDDEDRLLLTLDDGSSFRIAVDAIVKPVPNWPNPWADMVIPVPLERLASVVDPANPHRAVSIWKTYGDVLDAYVFKTKGSTSVGIRYGPGGADYLSPLAVAELELNRIRDEFS